MLLRTLNLTTSEERETMKDEMSAGKHLEGLCLNSLDILWYCLQSMGSLLKEKSHLKLITVFKQRNSSPST